MITAEERLVLGIGSGFVCFLKVLVLLWQEDSDRPRGNPSQGKITTECVEN